MNQPHQPHQPQVPNSFNSWMASLLESALVNALTPIVERLDRIEDWAIAQPPVAQEQLNYVLEPISQQLANQQRELSLVSSALDELANSGEMLAATLTQRLQDDNSQVAALHQQVQALTEQLTSTINNLTQRVDNQSQDWQQLCSALTRLADRITQWERDQYQHSRNLTAQVQALTIAKQEQYQQLDSQKLQLASLTQDYNNLVATLTDCASTWNQAVELIEQSAHKQEKHNQHLESLCKQISSQQQSWNSLTQSFNSLVTTLTPWVSGSRQLIEQLTQHKQDQFNALELLSNRITSLEQQAENQRQDLISISNSLGELAKGLQELVQA